MRVLAPQYSDEVGAVLSFPVVTVAAIYAPFAAQQDAGEARWGALVNAPEAVAAQPPPQLAPGTGALPCLLSPSLAPSRRAERTASGSRCLGARRERAGGAVLQR